MFDTIHNPVRTEYVTKEVKITENRAPIDKSLQLLTEMEEKVTQRLLGRIAVNDNSVNLEIAALRDVAWDAKIVRYRLTINGKQYDGSVKINEMVTATNGVEYVVEQIIDDIARTIAVAMINSLHGTKIRELVL